MMFMTRRRFEKTLIVTVALAGLMASASTFAAVVKSQIVAVKAIPGARPNFEIFSDSGQVYTTGDKALAQRLATAANDHRLQSLVMSDNEIIDSSDTPASEARNYTSPLDGMNGAEMMEETRSQALASDLHELSPSFNKRENNKGEKDEKEMPSEPVPMALAEARSMGFEPTILASMDDAQRLFDRQRDLKHSSQCHERAMVWAYDMYSSSGVRSMKTVMFFTDKFRAKYGVTSDGFFGKSFKPYKWWYHTAPFVYVGNDEIVLDKEFMARPMPMDDWSYWFTTEAARYAGVTPPSLAAGAKCVEITKYRPTSNGQPIDSSYSDCLFRKLPMYYMMPASFAANDCNPATENAPGRGGYLNDGRPKYPCYREVLNGFPKWAIKTAYENASSR